MTDPTKLIIPVAAVVVVGAMLGLVTTVLMFVRWKKIGAKVNEESEIESSGEDSESV